MPEVLIAGHRNPDLDSACSSTAYAYLKSRLYPDTRFTAIRSGTLSPQIRDVYEQADIAVPVHVESIEPTVSDVVKTYDFHLALKDPVLRAFELVRERTISAIPVFNEDDAFAGVVGVNEIAAYASNYHAGGRPEYRFSTGNFNQVLPGRFLQKGVPEEFSAPIVTGAMPAKRAFERMSLLNTPPLLIVGNRSEILDYAIQHDFPAVVITGLKGKSELEVDFSDYRGSVFLSFTDTAESIRLLRLSSEIDMIVDKEVPRLEHTTPFDAAKLQLLGSEYRGFPVFKDGHFTGMVTRRSFIERPRPKLILVDHNELDQAVEGAEFAEIVEIIDHHRLDLPKTSEPISVRTRPLGSTSTIVWEEFLTHGISIPRNIGILLLSGILSDTVNLQSPTATLTDSRAVESLEGITGLSAEEQTKRLFSRLSLLKERNAYDVVSGDFKVYEEAGLRFGIGQVEVTTLVDVDSYAQRMIAALEDTGEQKRLDWTMLLVTDVIKGDSILLTNGFRAGDDKLVYHKITERIYLLKGLLSRKKQLLPEIVRITRELQS